MREAHHVLGIVLAGGEGKRLYPLTADRAKPAVPFCGAYRLNRFVLSNLLNAPDPRICVFTPDQYPSPDPPPSPDLPPLRPSAGDNTTFVSMGNYIFTTKVLIDAIRADADNDHSDHDMGGDIIPTVVDDGMAAVYDFNDNDVPGATGRDRAYWRDVGTLDAFYDAHMDLVSVHPVFNLYNKRWPILGASENLAPAKFVNGGSAQESVVGAGSIISASSVRNSVVSSNVVVDDGAIVEGSVIMPGVRVGRGAVVRHAILDKNVVVGPREMVGVDLEKDRERFAISAGGVVAVGKGVWI